MVFRLARCSRFDDDRPYHAIHKVRNQTSCDDGKPHLDGPQGGKTQRDQNDNLQEIRQGILVVSFAKRMPALAKRGSYRLLNRRTVLRRNSCPWQLGTRIVSSMLVVNGHFQVVVVGSDITDHAR